MHRTVMPRMVEGVDGFHAIAPDVVGAWLHLWHVGVMCDQPLPTIGDRLLVPLNSSINCPALDTVMDSGSGWQ